MPYLQLDVPFEYPLEVKRDLAKRLSEIYADVMQTTPDLVTVAFRELREGNVWRYSVEGVNSEGPLPAAVLMCFIRRGRPAEQRKHLAEALHEICVEKLKLDPLTLSVEFNQHAGDEVYMTGLIDGKIVGGLGLDWSPDEDSIPMVEKIKAMIGQSGEINRDAE